ncbi:MAG: hypothetical protein P8X46_11030, partial [Nitrospirales bacterium]
MKCEIRLHGTSTSNTVTLTCWWILAPVLGSLRTCWRVALLSSSQIQWWTLQINKIQAVVSLPLLPAGYGL